MDILESLQQSVGYHFREQSLLLQALTHRSAGARHNERLEFLGDAALNFVVAAKLFARFPKVSEGDLSRMRARLVREETLAEIAGKIALADSLILGPGEIRSGGARRDSIRADALEAVIGAAFLDGGFGAAERIVAQLVEPLMTDDLGGEELRDPKTRLQEFLQGQGRPVPVYTMVAEKGQAHERRFVARCSVPGAGATEAEDGSRRKAEQRAAVLMLAQLQVPVHG
ncbi:ribonuclease III [Acidithiobacillus ferrooxidans F221]|uniref:ribonuclease III n=1 Tax=Acidithiobacillus ferrooxidans TaxID=920 RepID=UPI001C078504|nr:ribonuclease III [Acidithiobacillus ferrooxidans]MBU2808777.1 ribonuclease III [Acidithiobacillus ferrooxidans F221]